MVMYREGLFASLANNQDIGRVRALTRFNRHLARVGDSDYRLRRPGSDYGPPLALPVLMHRVRNLTKIAAAEDFIGYKLVARSDTAGAETYAIMLTDPAPDLTDTPGNAYVDLVYTMVFAKFERATNLGNCYCRHIDGSSSWSQHAYCNAQDFGAPMGPYFWQTLDQIAAYIVGNAAQWGTETVIVRDRIWTRGNGWNYYGGQYHYHVHTDGYPNGVGTPDCAR